MSNRVLTIKQQTLLTLLADGEFHSGTALAHCLGVSRVAVAKQLNQLADVLGLELIAVTGKGYRLALPLELLNHDLIMENLITDSRELISKLEIHTQIDSTNRYLMEQLRQQSVSGRVCFAEQQTHGKGRRGRVWVSPFGHNIYLSIAWQFSTGAVALSGLSLAVGVAVIRALKQLGIGDVGLKWPNDIYAQGKKLGGVLIEVSGETDGTCNTVIGVGLNVYLAQEQGANITQAWTDLTTLLGQRPSIRNALASSL
ncbi:partial BirA family transcriptional regulator, biotin operon repressor / biotin---[acetyl-CoA-carboxylase] ligase, partial [uncultured bacterium]